MTDLTLTDAAVEAGARALRGCLKPDAVCLRGITESDAAVLAHAVLQAALPNMQAKNDWRPIETAPRDGQQILGADYAPGDGWKIYSMFWNYSYSKPFWQGGGFQEHPTHWMPLPSPPALEAASEERGDG